MTALINFMRDDEGATAIEYALIAGLIAVVIIVAVTAAGDKIKGMFQTVADAL